jgi:hypothetical protein
LKNERRILNNGEIGRNVEVIEGFGEVVKVMEK